MKYFSVTNNPVLHLMFRNRPCPQNNSGHKGCNRQIVNVSKKSLILRLSKYGFVEISNLMNFVTLLCDEVPGYAEYLYINAKLREYLDVHDNGSDYFHEIHMLVLETEIIIDLEKQKI